MEDMVGSITMEHSKKQNRMVLMAVPTDKESERYLLARIFLLR